MTGWRSTGPVRHIPEEELHAYLDQALSRSQCVEIECHIAECRTCEQVRSRVAAVRDRTTALLADAAPPRTIQIPPFERLVARHEARRTAGAWVGRARRGALLAAGLAVAVGVGWLSRGWIGAERTVGADGSVAFRPSLALAEPELAGGPTPTDGSAARPTELDRSPVEQRAMGRSLFRVDRSSIPDGIVQVNAVAADDESLSFDGLWQTVDAQRAAAETGGNLPRIEGLPILEIQLQRGSRDERPTVVVYQQHPSGRVVRTIEGPMDRVEELVARHSAQNVGLHASQPDLTPPDYLGDGGAAARRVLRIVTVTGLLPADSLNALAKTIALKE